MAPVQVLLSVLDGALPTEPSPVKVNPRDRVAWKTTDGDLTVEFPSDKNPFTVDKKLKAKSGQFTEAVEVRHDVPRPEHFKCTITIGHHTFSDASGVDTPGTRK